MVLLSCGHSFSLFHFSIELCTLNIAILHVVVEVFLCCNLFRLLSAPSTTQLRHLNDYCVYLQIRYISTDGAAPNRAAIKRAMSWKNARVFGKEYTLKQPGKAEFLTFIMDIKVSLTYCTKNT